MTIYYTSKTGDNTTGLSAAHGKTTIAAGYALCSAGDTLIIKGGGGTYYERLRPTTNGSSGSPITITGERGASGEWLTVVDGSDLLTTWVAAPEVGTGVWKTTAPTWTGPVTGLANEPSTMTADGKSVWHISYNWADGGLTNNYGQSAFDILAVSSASADWDGIEALFCNQGGNTYVRFRDGDDPNSKTMRVAPWSYRSQEIPNDPDFGVFYFNDTDYNIVQNLELAGACGVVVNGSSTGNIIQNNSIHDSSQYGVHLNNGPDGTIVRNNTIYGNMIGSIGSNVPQSWEPASSGVGSNIYNINKYDIGNNASSVTFGVGCYLTTGTQVTGNTIYNLALAAFFYYDVDFSVSSNTIYNLSSLAVYFELTDGDCSISDNLAYNANGTYRSNNCDTLPSTLTVSIYRNKTYQPVSGVGAGMDFSMFGASATCAAKLYIYHNTQIGGFNAISYGRSTDQTFPDLLMVNNLMQMSTSSWIPYEDYSFTGTICGNSIGTAGWDYNWSFGQDPMCDFAGGHNVWAGTKIFDDTSLPTDWSPSGSAVSAGIDISASFDVNSVTYPALPGFSPGYFTGGAPNMGASQISSTPEFTPPVDDFDSYTPTDPLAGQSGGSGTWSGDWANDGFGGPMTIIAAPGGGQGGNAVEAAPSANAYCYREFSPVSTGVFRCEIRSNVTNPNHDDYGFSLNEYGVDFVAKVQFSSGGNIRAYDYTGVAWVNVLVGFSANTWYRVNLEVDSASHSGDYRVQVNEGTWTSWIGGNGLPYIRPMFQFNNFTTNGTIRFDAIGATTAPSVADISQMILDKILKDDAFAVFPVWLSLHTGPTGLDGANEVSGGSYGRFPASESYWGTPANRTITNVLEMQFSAMPVTTVTWAGLWSASSGGTFIRGVALNNPKTLKAGDVPKFEVGSLSFQLTADFSTFLANELLAYLFTGTAFTSAPAYWSLHTGAKDDTGGNEVAGGSYGRQEATIADWAATGDSILGDTVFSLDFEALVEFTGMPAAELTRLGLFDASSSGHFLMWGPSTPLSVGSGETVSIDGTVAGTLGATLTQIP